ncbi:MAG: HNH endonuclease [Cellulosilyticum sp.]|nr:HNH endonuclease [Cellulosilyticum sp.]
MLKSCKYCGKIHDSKYDCGMKPRYRGKVNNKKELFRKTKAWTVRSIEIRDRDHNLCQVCKRNIRMTDDMRQYEYDNLSVHHIYSLQEDFDKRLDGLNLITVCSYHHELCENGRIDRRTQLKIASEQEGIPPTI